MKVAAIDIGTNSMRLLIADYEDGKLYNRQKFVNTTRIGQDVDKDGYINKQAIDRNILALKEYVNKAKESGCENIYCMGTSALRDSKNKVEFIELARIETGIEVEIISGKEEADVGFLGVLNGCDNKGNIIVIDIGGGSTEFIIGSNKGIELSKSEDVGALRMTEKFLKSDPINNSEFNDMSRFIEEKINSTIETIKGKNIKTLIGIGGTITSVSAINQNLEVYSMEKIHNSRICKKELENILQKFKNMTLSDRKEVKGLQPKRADIITAGVEILDIIMEKIEIESIIVSEYDNLEGLLCKKLKKMS